MSSFADAYESKADVVDYGRRESGDGKSQSGKSARSGRSGNSGSRFGEVKDPLSPPDPHHMDSSSALLAIEESNNSLLGDAASRATAADATASLISRAPSSASQTTRLTEYTSGTFVPRRFDEMRTLLTSVTPSQLEALVDEMFDADAPPGWKDGRSRRSRNYRGDAYLSEMSLGELRHFASGMDRTLREGMERCVTADDALDLIAVEFERLVSRHQNGLFDEDETLGNSTLETRSHFLPEDDVRVSIDADSTTVHSESASLVSQDVGAEDEGANLRRSLRACSLPELRLVAERLQLDHSGCGTKADLIVMIERNMPDMDKGGGDGDGGYDQQQEGYDQQRPQPQHQQQQPLQQQQQRPKYDRNNPPPPPSQPPPGASGRVKFASDTKADRSHLIPRREKDGGAWQSYVTGPAAGGAEGGEFTSGPPGGRPDVDREYGEHEGYYDDDDRSGSYMGGPGRPLVDEYGNEYHDDEGYRDGRDPRGGPGPNRGPPKRGRDRYVDERKSRRRKRRYALPAPLVQFVVAKRLHIAGLLAVIGAAVAVSLVLTGKDKGPPIEVTFPDPDDPWSMDVKDGSGRGGEPTLRPSPVVAEGDGGDKSLQEIFESFTRTPVAAPRIPTTPRPFSWADMYRLDDDVETDEPTREPTPFPGSAVESSWADNDGWVDNDEESGEVAEEPLKVVDPSRPQNYCASYPGNVQETCGTNPRYCNDEPCEPGTGTFCFPMQICDSPLVATGASDPGSSGGEEMAVPIRDDEEEDVVPEFTFEVSTPEPTDRPSPGPVSPPPTMRTTPPPTASLYPLIGPVDQRDMRIVLYGVSRLSVQGRTQWVMLTAAYVEQFFELNDGEDAVQNIVFDVVASVKMVDQEDLRRGLVGREEEGGGGLNLRHHGDRHHGDRVLQGSSSGVVLTFDLSISYRTRSAFVTTEAVAERPFYDAGIRAGYVRFLSENNANAFIGDVTGVSSVFRGDDLPDKVG